MQDHSREISPENFYSEEYKDQKLTNTSLNDGGKSKLA